MSARRPGRPAAAGPERARGRPQRGAAPPAPRALLAGPVGRPARAADAAVDDIPHQRQPDWIGNRLEVHGPAEDVAAFRRAAEGAGVVPWRMDDRAAGERWLGLILAAAGGRAGTGLAAEARGMAGELRAAWLDEASAAAEASVSGGCPLDLHALLPVPAAVLALGPDDPAALRWMWENWGTTWPLRRVHIAEPARAADGESALVYGFFSADWSPWQALVRMRRRWRALRFRLVPKYA